MKPEGPDFAPGKRNGTRGINAVRMQRMQEMKRRSGRAGLLYKNVNCRMKRYIHAHVVAVGAHCSEIRGASDQMLDRLRGSIGV